MTTAKHLLVIRFSSMGDVAMTVPIIKEILEQNPELTITYLSRPSFEALFREVPRLYYMSVDIDNEYKGVWGLIQLFFSRLNVLRLHGVADLHGNLRSTFLRSLFWLKGVKTAHIKKGRKEKKMATRFIKKVLKPLKPMSERYADVFRALKIKAQLSHKLKQHPLLSLAKPVWHRDSDDEKWIGIAPFAKYPEKTYFIDRIQDLIFLLVNRHNVKIFLFGGGSEEEREICDNIASKYDNVFNMVMALPLYKELNAMGMMDVFVTMDSANMHLASLRGIPVVSIWGATHPHLGFLGYGQSEKDVVSVELVCRPCSVYGNKPCFRPNRERACFQYIFAGDVLSKVERYL